MKKGIVILILSVLLVLAACGVAPSESRVDYENMDILQYIMSEKPGKLSASALQSCRPEAMMALVFSAYEKGDHAMLSTLWLDRTFEPFEPIIVNVYYIDAVEILDENQIIVRTTVDMDESMVREPYQMGGSSPHLQLLFVKTGGLWKIERFAPNGI